MTNKNWAWAAGFFDGEGHASVVRGKVTKKGCEYTWVRASMSAGQASLVPLYELQRLFGGKITLQKPDKRAKLPFWKWELTRKRQIYRALSRLYPFLTVKRRNAFLVLSFLRFSRKRRPGNALTDVDRFAYEWYRLKTSRRRSLDSAGLAG